MNVTYLIGNGFDIACGLNTRYTDFIKKYLQIKSQDLNICDFKSYIEENSCTWADAELAFGKLTQKVQNAEIFKSCFRDFLDNLFKYLLEQQSLFKHDEIMDFERRLFLSGVKFYNLGLNEESSFKIVTSSNYGGVRDNKYNFLIFNYTNVFETYLRNSIKEYSIELEKKQENSNSGSFNLGSLEYVHGSLKDPPLIFGVNDVEQIEHIPLRSSSAVKQLLLKPLGNLETRRLKYERCRSIILQSDIICVYGMSVGLTDSLWWNEILTIMNKNEKLNLIIHCWNPECNLAIAGDVIETTEFIKRKFFNCAYDTSIQKSLGERIHISINQNPFRIFSA